ncbi:unnamed protein product [Pleuronectes platessa]|uniref:Uncharacterized protein n=1 Tax=Pleuronectes platessa TaxID=8262 RepID=A0A9N7V368_PLEPL|nr:unnamed protein product [Pleuronectes platessa]
MKPLESPPCGFHSACLENGGLVDFGLSHCAMLSGGGRALFSGWDFAQQPRPQSEQTLLFSVCSLLSVTALLAARWTSTHGSTSSTCTNLSARCTGTSGKKRAAPSPSSPVCVYVLAHICVSTVGRGKDPLTHVTDSAVPLLQRPSSLIRDMVITSRTSRSDHMTQSARQHFVSAATL